jgi:hypothetical protein
MPHNAHNRYGKHTLPQGLLTVCRRGDSLRRIVACVKTLQMKLNFAIGLVFDDKPARARRKCQLRFVCRALRIDGEKNVLFS